MTGTDIDVVNLRTGELLEHLDQQPPEARADALDAIHARQTELKKMAEALETSLRRTLEIRQVRRAVFGEYEVAASVRRESVWDAEELEAAMTQLVDEGVVRAGETADVIRRDPVVSRSNAKALLGRLQGDARSLVEATCTWREKPGPLTVTRSAELLLAGSSESPAPVSDLNPEELFK